jgi:hypothetical protein
MEKVMGPGSAEVNIPAACRQIKAAHPEVTAMYYLNSLIDYSMFTPLHDALAKNPEFRLKDSKGKELNPYMYNLGNAAFREMWIADIVNATENGCDGVFIDKSRSGGPGGAAYIPMHTAALVALDAALQPLGKFALLNNQGGVAGQAGMMIENFAGSQKCIEMLITAASRGFTTEVHAGDISDNASGKSGNTCVDGDTNAMAAFLIGAGDYSYYHCSGDALAGGATKWSVASTWPAVRDYWLDWLPEYTFPLGMPLGPATKAPSAAPNAPSGSFVWTRKFASGTQVVFDAGSRNGTISWAHGLVQVGPPSDSTVDKDSCSWQTM